MRDILLCCKAQSAGRRTTLVCQGSSERIPSYGGNAACPSRQRGYINVLFVCAPWCLVLQITGIKSNPGVCIHTILE